MESDAESYSRNGSTENENGTHTYYVTAESDTEQEPRARGGRERIFKKCGVGIEDKPQKNLSAERTPRTYNSNIADGHCDNHTDQQRIDIHSKESVWNNAHFLAEDEGDQNKEEVNVFSCDSEESEEEEEIWIETYTVPVAMDSPSLTNSFTYYGQQNHGLCNAADSALRTQSDSSVTAGKGGTSSTRFSHRPISSIQYQRQDLQANTRSPTSIYLERNNSRLQSDNTQDRSVMDSFANETKSVCCPRTTSKSPSRKDAFVKNVTATGASDIQTITRVDSETENVVVLIRPRQRSPVPPNEPSTSVEKATESSLIDSNENEVQRISVRALKNEYKSIDNVRKDCSNNRAEIDGANGCEHNVHMYNNFERPRPAISVSNSEYPPSGFTTEDKTDFVDTVFYQDFNGAKPKMVPQQRGRSRSFPERTNKQKNRYRRRANYDSQRLSPVPETVTDRDYTCSDSEDDDIKQLLESMHSVISGSSYKVKQGMTQGVVTNLNDAENSTEDTNHCPDDDKDRPLSERLKKKRSGGVTVITFLSPSYDKSNIGFTPLRFKTTKTVPVKAHDVFMQQATNTPKSLPRDQITVVKESSRSSIFSSQKLTIPRLHFASDQIIGKEHYIDNSFKNGAEIH